VFKSDKTLIVIAGPTAIGKTAMAIKAAKHFGTEIVSADSRQFYREMEIGTAKPSPEQLSTVKHHFINSHSITDEITVGDYEKEALLAIDSIFKTYNSAILTGGSGLFIKAVTEGFDELPKADLQVRSQLNMLFQKEGITALQFQLRELDPKYFDKVDSNNPQRLIRALEVCISSGKAFSSLRSNTSRQRPFNIIKIGLSSDREKLYHRINKRVDQMIEAGLVEEVSRLIPYRHFNALNTVGYTEIFDFIDGSKSLAEAIEKIKQNTRRFAKRQLTWFRKDPAFKWFDTDQEQQIIDYISGKI